MKSRLLTLAQTASEKLASGATTATKEAALFLTSLLDPQTPNYKISLSAGMAFTLLSMTTEEGLTNTLASLFAGSMLGLSVNQFGLENTVNLASNKCSSFFKPLLPTHRDHQVAEQQTRVRKKIG